MTNFKCPSCGVVLTIYRTDQRMVWIRALDKGEEPHKPWPIPLAEKERTRGYLLAKWADRVLFYDTEEEAFSAYETFAAIKLRGVARKHEEVSSL